MTVAERKADLVVLEVDKADECGGGCVQKPGSGS
jgi:hypothetical protein